MSTAHHTTRINARLDPSRTAKLEALKRSTRLGVSDLIKRGIDLLYEGEIERRPADPLKILSECGFVGSAEGPPDLSERYKEELAELLAAKHADR